MMQRRTSFRRIVAALLFLIANSVMAQSMALDASLRERIDQFVDNERQASGIPGIALAILKDSQIAHMRGFGNDGYGRRIGADTPFPIGSLTKSFTALLIRQSIDSGQLDVDTPVQQYLPWFRVADTDASARITLRHLLNQTSGFSRADGIAPLLQHNNAGIEELARGLAATSLNRPVGERFEYSNLNFMLLGAVLQAVTGQSWESLVHSRVFEPLRMTHSYSDHDVARQAGMTATHRMWFGVPIAEKVSLQPGFVPTGGLVSSVSDMSRYLIMLMNEGSDPNGPMVSNQGVVQLLSAAAPMHRVRLSGADFEFRYGEGWFVGPFGAARDARWHQGSLATFVAWMVLLPDTKQAVLLLINANTELPFGDVNAVTSRLPIGVVNLLRGQAVPHGPSLRAGYRAFNVTSAAVLIVIATLAGWASHGRGIAWPSVMSAVAIAGVVALHVIGLNVTKLWAFAPDLALVVAAAVLLLCLPALLRLQRGIRNGNSRSLF